MLSKGYFHCGEGAEGPASAVGNKGVDMYKCRPSKWFLLAPVFAGLPWLAASWLSSGAAVNDVQTRAAAALGAVGAPWATVNMDGRDVILSGDAPSQDALDAAVKAVAGTYGVRTVANQLLVKQAEVPVQPAAETPAVTPPLPAAPPAAVTEAPAPAPAPEAPKPEPLAAPVITTAPVTLAAPDAALPSLSGTWPEKAGMALAATLAGKTYTLGNDSELTSDGKGVFTLTPPAGLAPGSYDLGIKVTDAAGQTAEATQAAALVIPEPPAPPAPAVETPAAPPAPAVEAPAVPAAPPAAVTEAPVVPSYDCAAAMAQINGGQPIHFAFSRTYLGPENLKVVAEYAALLKDQRCAAEKAEVSGHADYYGSRVFNQWLSEARAQRVVDALVANGVEAGRLAIKGYSENEPLVNEKTYDARVQNRRVVITLVK